MEEKNQDKKNNTCMACSCPCEKHTEHNHPTDSTCKTCGPKDKKEDGGTCAC